MSDEGQGRAEALVRNCTIRTHDGMTTVPGEKLLIAAITAALRAERVAGMAPCIAWHQAREQWREHFTDCTLCTEYYTEMECLCEEGAKLMRDLTTKSNAMSEHIAQAIREQARRAGER